MKTSGPSVLSRTSITVAASRSSTEPGSSISWGFTRSLQFAGVVTRGWPVGLPAVHIGDRSTPTGRHPGEVAAAGSDPVHRPSREPLLEVLAQGDSAQREEKQQPDPVGEEPGREHQGSTDEQEGTVDQLVGREATLGRGALEAPENTEPLEANEPGPDEADEDHETDGLPAADDTGDLDHDIELHHGQDEEEQEEQSSHELSLSAHPTIQPSTTLARVRPPSVDKLARSLADTGLPHPLLVEAARAAIDAGDPEAARAEAERVQGALLRPVINATGVLLHTNLGRAPWPHHDGGGYSNLEFDLATGKRGSRRLHAGGLLARACGAEAALVVNNCASAVLLTLAALIVLNSTLTLPGIAGLILGIGMAVDSNVLIFERMREEIRDGKAIAKAIGLGFDRAFITIIDTHITTIIAAIILYLYGSGPIRGFAVTLVLGLIINLFSAVYVSRTIFLWLLERNPDMKKLSV